MNCICPTRAEKDAFDVATTWVNDGKEAAASHFAEISAKRKLTRCEAAMFYSKVERQTELLDAQLSQR